jgi:hypothetical protein
MVSEYWTECMSSGCWNLISPNERHNYSETTIANSRKTTYYIDPMGRMYALSDSVHPLHIICWTVHRQNDSEDGCSFSWFSSTVKIVFFPRYLNRTEIFTRTSEKLKSWNDFGTKPSGRQRSEWNCAAATSPHKNAISKQSKKSINWNRSDSELTANIEGAALDNDARHEKRSCPADHF